MNRRRHDCDPVSRLLGLPPAGGSRRRRRGRTGPEDGPHGRLSETWDVWRRARRAGDDTPLTGRESRAFQRWVIRAILASFLLSLGLGLGAAVGMYALADNSLERVEERNERFLRQERFNVRLCTALPDVADAASLALVEVIVERNRAQGAPREEIEATLALGERLRERARKLALEDLPECRRVVERDRAPGAPEPPPPGPTTP